MFMHLLGLKSSDSLKGPLACKQASFPITFGGIGPNDVGFDNGAVEINVRVCAIFCL